MSPNRIVALVTAGLSLVGAVLPVLADMDLTSTAGIFAGLISLDLVAIKWLDGWQRYEARVPLGLLYEDPASQHAGTGHLGTSPP